MTDIAQSTFRMTAPTDALASALATWMTVPREEREDAIATLRVQDDVLQVTGPNLLRALRKTPRNGRAAIERQIREEMRGAQVMTLAADVLLALERMVLESPP